MESAESSPSISKEKRVARRDERTLHSLRVPAYWRTNYVNMYTPGTWWFRQSAMLGKHDAAIVKTGAATRNGGMENDVVYSIHKKARWEISDDPVHFLAELDAVDANVTVIDGHYGNFGGGRSIATTSGHTGIQSIYKKDADCNLTEKHLRRQLPQGIYYKNHPSDAAGPSVEFRIHRGSPNPKLLIRPREKSWSHTPYAPTRRDREEYLVDWAESDYCKVKEEEMIQKEWAEEEEEEEEKKNRSEKRTLTLGDFLSLPVTTDEGFVWVD